jgi:hypothetical protein
MGAYETAARTTLWALLPWWEDLGRIYLARRARRAGRRGVRAARVGWFRQVREVSWRVRVRGAGGAGAAGCRWIPHGPGTHGGTRRCSVCDGGAALSISAAAGFLLVAWRRSSTRSRQRIDGEGDLTRTKVIGSVVQVRLGENHDDSWFAVRTVPDDQTTAVAIWSWIPVVTESGPLRGR